MCKTPLYAKHLEHGAKMTAFSGWWMPVHYGSQLQEHHHVRQVCGMFDVSHMTIVDIQGGDRKAFLTRLLANDVRQLRVIGQAQYTLMLNESGGILDDLIVYYLPDRYRLVVNCSTRVKVLDWLRRHAETVTGLEIVERGDLAMLAVQGVQACRVVGRVLGDEAAALIGELLPFTSVARANWQMARTGYTGEDGLEIILPGAEIVALWDRLIEAGVAPCGLGARDTLRLEAGLRLYGQDMDESTTPWEAGLGWTVSLKDDRHFVGRAALEKQREAGTPQEMIGLWYEGKGILRGGYDVVQNEAVIGQITSGSYAPSLSCSVGLARVRKWGAEPVLVRIRNRCEPVLVVKPPFIKRGQPNKNVRVVKS
ncbi:MAG: glycine cleavage system aminomethyltransferase GcvT [Gammaproteobacteria bacterium]